MPETLNQLLPQLEKYSITIAAIQEQRWNGQGSLNKKHHTVFYCYNEREHIDGMKFIVGKKIATAAILFKAVDPRKCNIRMKGKFHNFSLFSIHAPTELSNSYWSDS